MDCSTLTSREWSELCLWHHWEHFQILKISSWKETFLLTQWNYKQLRLNTWSNRTAGWCQLWFAVQLLQEEKEYQVSRCAKDEGGITWSVLHLRHLETYQNHDYCPLKLSCRSKLPTMLASRHIRQSSWSSRSTIFRSDVQTFHRTSLFRYQSMNKRWLRDKLSHRSISKASRVEEPFYVFAIDRRADSPNLLFLSHSLIQPKVESTFF